MLLTYGTVENTFTAWKKDTGDEKASAQTFPQTGSGPAHRDRDGV